MRLSVDVGGTFTDLVVVNGDGRLALYKTLTTSPDPIDGVLAVLETAASERGRTLREFLATADTFIHSTTRAINAVVTGTTAKTAFLVTAGNPDILVLREGGRADPFNYRIPFPPPYVPRSALLCNLPVIHEDDSIGHVASESHLVSNNHHRHSVSSKIAHDREHLADQLRIKR